MFENHHTIRMRILSYHNKRCRPLALGANSLLSLVWYYYHVSVNNILILIIINWLMFVVPYHLWWKRVLFILTVNLHIRFYIICKLFTWIIQNKIFKKIKWIAILTFSMINLCIAKGCNHNKRSIFVIYFNFSCIFIYICSW